MEYLTSRLNYESVYLNEIMRTFLSVLQKLPEAAGREHHYVVTRDV